MTTRLRMRIGRLEKMFGRPAVTTEEQVAEELDWLDDAELGRLVTNLRMIQVQALMQAGAIAPEESARVQALPDDEFLAWLNRRDAEIESGEFTPTVLTWDDAASEDAAGEEPGDGER